LSVFRPFNRNDILFSTIHTRPRISVKYGVNGWEGSTGVSASLSLYGGIRSRRDVKSSDYSTSGLSLFPLDPLDTHSIDKVIFVSGSYPSTGSIRFVRCTNDPASIFSLTSTRWHEEHYRPIDILFDYYSGRDTNYFTGSYDFYDALLLADVDINVLGSGSRYYPGPYYAFSGAFSTSITGPNSSFTAEAWIKPLPTSTSSLTPFIHKPVIFSQRDTWNLFLNESGALALAVESSSSASYPGTSTIEVNPAKWNHVALVVSSGVSASYWINGTFGGTVGLGSGTIGADSVHPLLVGGYESRTASTTASSQTGHNLNGFIFETRIWNIALSGTTIQKNLSGTLISSSSANLVHYARFNDGPFGTAHGFTLGSGAFDYSPNAKSGYMLPWSFAHTTHWQPNDHPSFIPTLRKANLNISDLRLVHVPSMFYGRQIDPGSVRIMDGVYNKRHIVRVLNDDGRGTLYISGSMTRDLSGEEYQGERRRKVGNVFYTEGLIVLTDPSLYDVFDSGSIFWQPSVSVSGVFGDLFSVDFKGQGKINTKTFNCRVPSAQVNASNNPTFSYLDDRGTVSTDDDRLLVARDDGTTYITSIGLYNEDKQLVAVAKIAQPIRKREKDRENIRLKFDF
jgi:hypothetical protein